MPSTDLTTPVTRRAGGLVADDYGHADARPPIVLLHGMTFDRTIWRPLVTELHQLDPGRRVLAIDLPGHGQSSDRPAYDLDHVPAELHRVITEAGLAAPIVVGHSAGALGATVYAGRYPTRGVVNLDQPLQIAEFAGFVQSLRDRLRGPASQVMAMIDTAMAAIGAAGVPYLHVGGHEPGEGYREWLAGWLPAATIDVWGGSGHFPHLAHQAEFARRLAAFAG